MFIDEPIAEIERSSLGMRDDGRHLCMKIRRSDRLEYNPNYERLETYIAILQVEHAEEPVKMT